jgi:hypothetical protein
MAGGAIMGKRRHSKMSSDWKVGYGGIYANASGYVGIAKQAESMHFADWASEGVGS